MLDLGTSVLSAKWSFWGVKGFTDFLTVFTFDIHVVPQCLTVG